MRVATDIGGTFTDLVAVGARSGIVSVKNHTTPPNFENGIIDVLAKSGVAFGEIESFIHGTTTIINALTERKGSKTAFLTTKGFRDVLEIARMNRPDLFNLVFKKPVPFVPRHLRKEVSERVMFDGEVLSPICLEDVDDAVEYFKAEGVEAIAVCFINSYANDSHERQAAERIRALWPGVFVTASTDVTREWREYERGSTAALNSYVMPAASSYIDNLEKRLAGNGINCKKFIMQSNGGSTTFEQAKLTPINIVESGPVAGVFGAAILGRFIGEENIIALDVGGTTAKCSLIYGGEVKVTTQYRIERDDSNAGYPIMCPVVDIVEIGNGGGSVAWIDEAGSLKVGPKSAGAIPGPVAYGIGGAEPTTTDASLLTGRLSPKNFDKPVDMGKVRAALVEKIGGALNMNAEETALSVIRVADSNMFNALKLISVRRGYDPREFTLVAFGGGGPMHCAFLGKELGVKKIVVPAAASVFSAWGMLMTDVRHDFIRTKISRLNDTSAETFNAMWEELLKSAGERLADDGIPKGSVSHSLAADIRYLGQEHTVKVSVPGLPWTEELKAEITERFHAAHERNYTYRLNAPVEIVNLHLVSLGKLEKPELERAAKHGGSPETALIERRKVYYQEGWKETPVYSRAKLGCGAVLSGPAIVEEASSSTLILSGQRLTVDEYGNLIIETEVQL